MPDQEQATEIIERLQTLKGLRGNFDSIWQDAKDLVWPDGGDFIEKRSPGEKTTNKVFEMTAANALERYAAAMESFLTPRTQKWHRLRATDDNLNEEAAVKEWFEAAEDTLFKIRNSSRARFYGQMHEVYKSLGLTGNGCIFVDELPSGGARYRFTHVGQTWIETNFEGIVDTVYYEYELTAKAAVQRWQDQAPKSAQNAIKAEPFQKHKYLHVVRPNDNADPERFDAAGMPFEAFEISLEDREIIERGGFEELPYMWTRFTVNPSEMYGRGPAMLTLPDIETLQEMEKTFLRAGHKVADPPLLVAHDGKLGRGSRKIRIAPGGLNMGGLDPQGRAMIQPLQTGARLDLTLDMMEQKRAIIREAFLNNLFDLLERDRVQMTATEVLERRQEKGQLITPVIGRQQAELLGPLITREVNIALRQGLLPPLPAALVEAEGEYEIEYESDATRMQKSDEVAAMARLTEVMAPYIEANPSLMAVVKGEDAYRHYGEVLGVPVTLFNTEREMDAIRKAMAQAQQRQAMAEQAPQLASAAKDLQAVGQEAA